MNGLLKTMRLAWLEAWTNRRGFWTQVTVMLVNDIVWVGFWVIFFRQVGEIRGWDTDQVLVLLAVLTTGSGISLGFLHNVRRLGTMIGNGELDSALALPVPTLAHLLVRKVDPIHLGDMAFGIVLFFGFCNPTPQRVGVFLAGTITAAAICTGFLILMGALSFYVGRSEAGDLGFHALLLTSSYPVDIFAGATKVLLYTVVPAGFMTAAPSRLVDDFDLLLAAGTVGVAVATVAVGTTVFNVGLRRYTSGSVWTVA